MRLLQVLAVLLLISVAASAQSTSPSTTPKPPKLEHFSPSIADPSAEPCDDFYKYACGRWIAANPIPPDQVAWGTAGPLQIWNETTLLKTLEKASADDPSRNAVDKKIGDYYYSCMDEKSIDTNTAAWIKPEVARIAAIKNKGELAAAIAHLHMTIPGAAQGDDNATPAAFMGFGGSAYLHRPPRHVAFIDQGGMGLPGRSFYLDQDDHAKQIRAKYQKHVQNMLVLGGEKEDQAAADAAVVLAMETDMAKAAMDPISRRDPKNINNKMSLAQVKALTPLFQWDTYLKLVQAPHSSPHYIVTSPEFFKNAETMLQQHPLEHWKTYLRWWMLHGSANVLSAAFVNENFDFYAKTLAGAKQLQPRWRRCVRNTDGNLGEALGQAYVAQAFPPGSKARVLKLVQDIEASLARDIDAQDWMAQDTKRQAKEKLHATLNKIGYPDQWRDYSSVKVGRESFLSNRQNAAGFEFRRQVKKIGTPVDRMEWGMTPPTINAYEDPQTNTINFPAGILQPPFFEATQDDAANYGAIGAVIGHETIHGFDDQGRKFDAVGNLRDWWSESDGKEYDKRGKCIADEYTQEIPEAGVKQDGRLTQGEDTADNGGVHLAYLALQAALERDGKNLDSKDSSGVSARQRFFLAYAFEWCNQYRPELMRTVVLTNPHSIPKYRVNNVVSNMPEFWEAYGCKKGQRMVRDNACRVW